MKQQHVLHFIASLLTNGVEDSGCSCRSLCGVPRGGEDLELGDVLDRDGDRDLLPSLWVSSSLVSGTTTYAPAKKIP